MQVGYVGLLKAINNFNPDYGGNLAAYAQPCISGEIKRHFRDKRWQVHVKRPVQELLLEVRKARGTLTQDLGHAPSDRELASHLKVSTEDIRDADRADLVFHPHSLDAPISAEGDAAATLGDCSVRKTRGSSRPWTWRRCPPTGGTCPSGSSASWPCGSTAT